MATENRSEPRHAIALPVFLAGGRKGQTRNLSASGLLLELEGQPTGDDQLDLSVNVAQSDESIRLLCRGEVVRVERWGDTTGLAVRLLESRLEVAH